MQSCCEFEIWNSGYDVHPAIWESKMVIKGVTKKTEVSYLFFFISWLLSIRSLTFLCLSHIIRGYYGSHISLLPVLIIWQEEMLFIREARVGLFRKGHTSSSCKSSIWDLKREGLKRKEWKREKKRIIVALMLTNRPSAMHHGSW